MTQHAKELKQIKDASGYIWPKGAFVAGGAITSVFTGQPINDVDFYFKTKEDFINAVGNAYDDSLWCLAATDRAVTFGNRDGAIIQFMLFDFFPEVQNVFDAFDFTVCMGAYDIDKSEFVFQEDFFKHAAQRHMSFHAGTRYPFGSLLRVLKYQDRGYKINRADMLRIGLAMHKVELNTWDDLAAAIGGQYGERALVDTNEEFSLDAAITLYANKPDVIVAKGGENMPGNAYDLLVKIGIEVVESDKFEKDDILWLKGE